MQRSTPFRTLLRVGIACLVLYGGAALGAFVASALAQPRGMACGERSNLIDTLEGKYKEQMRGVGYVSGAAVAELHISPKGGTWTIIMTNPEGVSCVLAAGKNWSAVKPPVAGKAL